MKETLLLFIIENTSQIKSLVFWDCLKCLKIKKKLIGQIHPDSGEIQFADDSLYYSRKYENYHKVIFIFISDNLIDKQQKINEIVLRNKIGKKKDNYLIVHAFKRDYFQNYDAIDWKWNKILTNNSSLIKSVKNQNKIVFYSNINDLSEKLKDIIYIENSFAKDYSEGINEKDVVLGIKDRKIINSVNKVPIKSENLKIKENINITNDCSFKDIITIEKLDEKKYNSTIDLKGKKEIQMANCPHPFHENETNAQQIYHDFYSCTDLDACNQPSFKCYHDNCEGLNRTYANYCVKCKKTIDFYHSYNKACMGLTIGQDIDNQQRGTGIFYEADFGDIKFLLHLLGYLFINAGKNGLFIFNGFNLRDGFLKRIDYNNPVISVNAFTYEEDKKPKGRLIVTTAKSVNNLLISKNFQSEILISDAQLEANEIFDKRAFVLSDESVVTFIKNNQKEIMLRHYNNNGEILYEKLLGKEVSIPHITKDNRVFFYTNEDVFIYENLNLNRKRIPHDINLRLNDYSISHKDNIFVPGSEKPYRLNSSDTELDLIPLFKKNFNVPRISLDSSNKLMYISHNEGLTITNPISESINWDLSHLGVGHSFFCQFSPAADIGNYIMFTSLSSKGHGMQVGFIPKNTRDDLLVASSDLELLLEPIVILNKLVLAIKENNKIKLKAITLCGT